MIMFTVPFLIGYPDAAMGHESYNLVKHENDTEISVDNAVILCSFGASDYYLTVSIEWNSKQRQEK